MPYGTGTNRRSPEPTLSEAAIRLDGQVVIVTGAGHGLGRGYACALAARGAAVLVNDVDAARAAAVVATITGEGGAALAETSSVATPEGGAAIVAAALDAFGGRIDAVVNNAGQLRNAAFDEMSLEDFRAVLDTHLAGAFHVTQPAFRHMKAAGYGRVVFTSSSATFGAHWQANYAAAKAGLIGLSNVVALEGAPHDIRANAIMPMALTGIGSGGPPPYPPDVLEETAAALAPISRALTVDNVAPVVVYLASRACADSGRVFSVGAGAVSRAFLGLTAGWTASESEPITPEHVAAHLDRVGALTDFTVPESMNDASRFVARNLAESRSPTP